MTLQKEQDATIKVFLMGDGVTCSIKDQKTANGYYNLERMIKSLIRKGGAFYLCGTCLDARGLLDNYLIANTQRSTMSELAELTNESDKVLNF